MDQVEHVRQTVGLVEANRVETSDFEETESGSTGKEVVGVLAVVPKFLG